MTKVTDNAAVLNGIKVVPAKLTWYAELLKSWYKQAGSKPTPAMLMVPELLGKRPGKEALHIAMCLRPEGCTVQQFVLAGSCGPANNYRRALVKSGWFNCTVDGKPYAFKLTVTAKGEAKLAKAQVQAEAEATVAEAPKVKSKPKGKRKAKAPVAEAPAETPISEAPEAPVIEPVNEPVQAEATA
jgi:hypothetical protein